MKIVLDCRSVFPGMGGIGRATACLARELPRALPEAELFFLTSSRRPEGPLAESPNVRQVDTEGAMIDAAFDQVILPGLLAELEADLYHNPCFSVPIAAPKVRRVATIHDVVFRRRPELVEPRLRDHLAHWTTVACEIADAVVTVSRFSQSELADLYGLAPERIDVVPNAVEARFFALERRQADRPFFLYVGSIEPKKNIAALFRGFAALVTRRPELPHQLILAGSGGDPGLDLRAELASAPGLEGRICMAGHVPEEQLLQLYASATAFVYLSEYEGFGLPPLEAMAAGTPAIVSARASLPEVTGGAALVVEPSQPESVAEALERILEDGGLARAIARRGRDHALRFSWRRSARQLADLYRRLLSRTPAGSAA